MSKTKVPDRSDRALFVMASLNMSWQLAIVVLLPILAGYKLDQRLGESPVFTILGLVLAMFGTAIVLWHQLQQFGPAPKTKAGGARD